VIPRYQTVFFVILLLASAIMGVMLWQSLNRAHQRLLAGESSTPTQAPAVSPSQPATLLVAHDADNSLLAQTETLPLPADPGSRARLILGRLLDLYAAPGSPHPVPGGAASIAQVFLLPIPAPDENSPAATAAHPQSRKTALATQPSDAQLAVVNLTSSFAANHPSGLETETLTIESICATLRANLPNVAEVRFLVDGQTRPTLAGHADLTRAYLTADSIPTTGTTP
jgi:Sporulation and spore germination